MNTVLDLFKNLWNLLVCIGELLGYPKSQMAFFGGTAGLYSADSPFPGRLVGCEGDGKESGPKQALRRQAKPRTVNGSRLPDKK